MFDDGVERPTDSAAKIPRKAEPFAGPCSENQSGRNAKPEVEFKPAWVYITYTLKIEDENGGKY